MGASLFFDATRPIDRTTADAVRSAINAAIDRLGDRQPWIGCATPRVYPVEADGRLVVGSALNLTPSPGERAVLDESPAEEPDLVALLRILADVSASIGVDWAARIDREPIGRIVDGASDEGLRAAIDALAEFHDSLGDAPPPSAPEPPPPLRIWPEPEAIDD